MRFGIDSHNAEREGEGNSTYGRNLIANLAAASDDHENFHLFAANPDHAFYRSLPPGDRFAVTHVVQGHGLMRLGWSLGRATRRERVDGLHVQYTAPLGYRGPLVVTVHDLSFFHVPRSFPLALRVALRVLVPWSLRRAARIVTDSEFSRRDIVSRYRIDSAKVVVTSLAADARFRPQSPEDIDVALRPYGLEPGFFLSLGRLNRRKNLERLLQAYAEARAKRGVAVPLVIGGKLDYGFEEVLRRSNLTAATSGIRFVGLIPDASLPAFYSAAACLVYPSLFEGFGLPVLEAMACGTPVIASNRSALPELVADAGILVDPEDVDALSQAMARLLADRELRGDLGRRGLVRSSRFSWGETARRTMAVYREAVREGGR